MSMKKETIQVNMMFIVYMRVQLKHFTQSVLSEIQLTGFFLSNKTFQSLHSEVSLPVSLAQSRNISVVPIFTQLLHFSNTDT